MTEKVLIDFSSRDYNWLAFHLSLYFQPHGLKRDEALLAIYKVLWLDMNLQIFFRLRSKDFLLLWSLSRPHIEA